MKKLCILMVSSAFSLQALPFAPVECTSVGFSGNYVFNRNLEQTPLTEVYTNSGSVHYAPWKKLILFGTLGASNINIQTRFSTLSNGDPGNEDVILETDTELSWSLGLRSPFLCWCGLIATAEAEFFQTSPHINQVTDLFFEDLIYPSEKVRYQEGQIGLGLSYPIDATDFATFIPYVAATWSRVNLTFHSLTLTLGSVRATFDTLKQSRPFGYAVGFWLTTPGKWQALVEGRFADERAVSVLASLVF